MRKALAASAGQSRIAAAPLDARRPRPHRLGHGDRPAAGLPLPGQARVSIDRAGQVLIETSTQEVGQGVSTILPQIAADVLGVPVERVALALGDTALPEAPLTGGSSATMSVGSAVQDAAAKLKAKLAEAGATGRRAMPERWPRSASSGSSAEGEWAPAEGEPTAALFSFGAIFAEVRVDEDIPIPRVSRVVGVYSAGRIINPKTARSQMTGGIIWGIGQALLERSEMDPGLGRFLSKNLCRLSGSGQCRRAGDRRLLRRGFRSARQPARRPWHRRARRHRHRAGDRQRRVPRHRHARPRSADPT